MCANKWSHVYGIGELSEFQFLDKYRLIYETNTIKLGEIFI